MDKNINEPHVCVIILNWNGLKWLKMCLPSVFNCDYSNFKVMVVDNGSGDGSVEWIKNKYPSVEVIQNKRNMGFAEGNNVGIRRALANKEIKYVITLNNDTEAEPSWLKELVGTAENEGVGMVASKMLFMGDHSKVNSAGMSVYTHGGGVDRGLGKDEKNNFNKQDQVFGPCAGAALYSKKMLQSIKLNNDYFDSDYFAYFEDIDLAWRGRLAGFKCLYNPRAIVYHKMHGTSLNMLKMKKICSLCLQNRTKNIIKNGSMKLFLLNGKYIIHLLHSDFKSLILNMFCKSVARPYRLNLCSLGNILFSVPFLLVKRNMINKTTTVPRSEIEKCLINKIKA